MYVYRYKTIYDHIYTYKCLYGYEYKHVYVCRYKTIYEHMYTYEYAYTNVYIYIYMYIYRYGHKIVEDPWNGPPPVVLEAGVVGVLPSPFKTASEVLGLLNPL